MTRLPFAALLLAALAAAGCQSKPALTFVPVEGTVTRDGKPLSGVMVFFWPDVPPGTPGPHSAGATDSAGHYQLHTDQGDEGAVPGRYRVCVVEVGAMLARMTRRPAPDRVAKELSAAGAAELPPAFGLREETPLRAVVQPGAQAIDFDVK